MDPFQLVIATDGDSSFAAFLYSDYDLRILQFADAPEFAPEFHIGFNAGDRRKWANIMVDSLETVNIFRIDGKEATALLQ